MSKKFAFRLVLLTAIAACSVVLFAATVPGKITTEEKPTGCTNTNKADKKSKTEFIMWESVSRHLLSQNTPSGADCE
jgi:hypothetical protein